MALLPNNRLYILDALTFCRQHQEYRQRVMEREIEDIMHHTTVEEDFNMVLRCMNGQLPNDDLYGYCRQMTNSEIEAGIMLTGLEELMDKIYQSTLRLIVELPSPITPDVYYYFDGRQLFILDRRKITYVPDAFFRPNFTRNSKPLFSDDDGL